MIFFEAWCTQLQNWQSQIDDWRIELPAQPQPLANPLACYATLMATVTRCEMPTVEDQDAQLVHPSVTPEQKAYAGSLLSGDGFGADLLSGNISQTHSSLFEPNPFEQNNRSDLSEFSTLSMMGNESQKVSATGAAAEKNSDQALGVNAPRNQTLLVWGREKNANKTVKSSQHLVYEGKEEGTYQVENNSGRVQSGSNSSSQTTSLSPNHHSPVRNHSTTSRVLTSDGEALNKSNHSVTNFPMHSGDLQRLLFHKTTSVVSEKLPQVQRTVSTLMSSGFQFSEAKINNSDADSFARGSQPKDTTASQNPYPASLALSQSSGTHSNTPTDTSGKAFRTEKTHPHEMNSPSNAGFYTEDERQTLNGSTAFAAQNGNTNHTVSDLDALYEELLERFRQEYRRTYGIGGG
jgi:hypothetical protein